MNVSIDTAKETLESMFPEIEKLEPIGSGKLGHAYLGTIGYDMVVVKMTNSLSEYLLTKIAMVSNPPHTVKFHKAEIIDEDKYLYAIVHDYVSRDAMPDEETWDLAVGYINGIVSDEKVSKVIITREQKYEFELAKKKISELEEYFDTSIDTLQQNWGYNDNQELVIFDLDGDISRPKYEKLIQKYK